MIIYKAACKANGKCYVGQTTKTLKHRSNQHIYLAIDRGCGTGAFANALRKYGADAFEWTEIDRADNREDLNELERAWIKILGTLSPAGYNLEDGGKVKIVHAETKQKISKKVKGRKKSDEHKKKLALVNTGKTLSQETRDKIRIATTGQKRTAEQCAAMSENHPRVQSIILECISNNKIVSFRSSRDACRILGASTAHMCDVLSGKRYQTRDWTAYRADRAPISQSTKKDIFLEHIVTGNLYYFSTLKLAASELGISDSVMRRLANGINTGSTQYKVSSL